MKYFYFISVKGTHVLLLLCAILIVLVSCSRKLTFNNSPIVPAAEGYVKMKKDNNKNYSIDVKVTNLAPPEKLAPPANTYVVWMETEQNGTKNIGQMKSDNGLLSKTLKGSLKTVTAYQPVRFFITAEEDGNASYPGMRMVLESKRR